MSMKLVSCIVHHAWSSLCDDRAWLPTTAVLEMVESSLDYGALNTSDTFQYFVNKYPNAIYLEVRALLLCSLVPAPGHCGLFCVYVVGFTDWEQAVYQ